MLAVKNYKAAIVHSLLFIVALIVSVYLNQPLYLLVPFLFIALQKILEFAIINTTYIFFLLIICLPLSTEWQVTPSLSLDFPTEPFLILLSFLAICKWIYQPKVFPIVLLKSNLFLLVLLHLIWLLINILFSTQPLISLKFFIAKVWYVIPFVMLLQHFTQTPNLIPKISKLLAVSMLLVIVQSLLRHSFEAFSFEGIKYTLSPFFRNHVNYSATLVLVMPILLYLKPFNKEAINKRWLNWNNIVVIIYFLGLFFAYSRGAWLAVLVGFIAAYAIKYNRLQSLIWSSIFMLVIVLFTFIYKNNFLKLAPQFNTTIYHSNLTDHLQATIALKDVSNAERFYRWIAGFNMVSEHPITGFGTNTFYHHYKQYTAQLFKTWVSNNDDHSTVHNYFLLTLIEQGIIGFLLFFGMMIVALLKAQKLYNLTSNLFYKNVAKVVGVMLVMICVLNFLSDLIETDKVGGLFWLCLGILIWLEEKINSEGLK